MIIKDLVRLEEVLKRWNEINYFLKKREEDITIDKISMLEKMLKIKEKNEQIFSSNRFNLWKRLISVNKKRKVQLLRIMVSNKNKLEFFQNGKLLVKYFNRFIKTLITKDRNASLNGFVKKINNCKEVRINIKQSF